LNDAWCRNTSNPHATRLPYFGSISYINAVDWPGISVNNFDTFNKAGRHEADAATPLRRRRL
jgi:hypothetical protein